MAKKPPSKRKNAEDVLDILLESSESGPMLGATSGSNEEIFKRLGVPKGRQTERFAEILKGAAWDQSGPRALSPINRVPIPEDFVGPPAPYQYRGDELDREFPRKGLYSWPEPATGWRDKESEGMTTRTDYRGRKFFVPAYENYPRTGDTDQHELWSRVRGETPMERPQGFLGFEGNYPRMGTRERHMLDAERFDSPYAEPSVQGRFAPSAYHDYAPGEPVAAWRYGPEGEAAHTLLRDYVKKKKK